MEGFIPGEECSLCKGRCCREKGCSLSPEDLLRELWEQNPGLCQEGTLSWEKVSKDRILSLLQGEKGLYAIDFFSQPKGRVYYLRMRHKCYTFIGVDAMGECVALTDSGCMLPVEKRPKGGRFLESFPTGKCLQHYTEEEMEKDWAPYQQMLSEIWQEFEPQFSRNGIFDKCDQAYFAWMKKERQKGSAS